MMNLNKEQQLERMKLTAELGGNPVIEPELAMELYRTHKAFQGVMKHHSELLKWYDGRSSNQDKADYHRERLETLEVSIKAGVTT